MKTALTLWDDTLRVIEIDAVKANNQNRAAEARNLRTPICISLGDLNDPDVDKEEAEWEAGQIIAAVRPRVLELIADRESGGEACRIRILLKHQ